jgi:hypothetical protein
VVDSAAEAASYKSAEDLYSRGRDREFPEAGDLNLFAAQSPLRFLLFDFGEFNPLDI